jgi:hypothetical protein
MVKGATSGTRSRRALAVDTSTKKVSLSASKPNEPTGRAGTGTARQRGGGWWRWRVVGGGSASWASPPKGERGSAYTTMGGVGWLPKAGMAGAGAEHGRIALDEANGLDSPMAEPEKGRLPLEP